MGLQGKWCVCYHTKGRIVRGGTGRAAAHLRVSGSDLAPLSTEEMQAQAEWSSLI